MSHAKVRPVMSMVCGHTQFTFNSNNSQVFLEIVINLMNFPYVVLLFHLVFLMKTPINSFLNRKSHSKQNKL